MKRLLVIFMIAVMLISIVSCGESSNETDKPDSNQNEGETIDQENGEDEVSPEEKPENNEEGDSDIYFKDNEVKTEDVKIKITETKVIPVGEEGNEYGEKPVFAIWYEATNLSDKDIDPSTAWIAIFTAIQDNDPNAINELEVGALPDENHLDSQTETIKKDGTVENSMAYELDDLETPVTLVATQGVMGDEIGREDYEIKQ